MIPIKNFHKKKPFLAKQASQMNKNGELIKNFKMPVIALIDPKNNRKKKKK